MGEEFRVAGLLLRVVDPPSALLPYRTGSEVLSVRLRIGDRLNASEPAQAVGWLGGREREVTSRAFRGGFHVSVGGAGEYLVQDGGLVLAALPPRVPDPMLYEEAILGPPLLLALALRGIFCLHASAVASGGGGLAILGESGHGKSTLARWLGEQSRRWRWLSDDITPIRPHPGGARIEPAFPQLKLARVVVPADVALRAFVELSPTAEPTPRLEALGPRDRFVALSRSVAAARLFGEELAGAAFDACSELARRLPGQRLHYPHRWEALPEVAALLAALLERSRADEREP